MLDSTESYGNFAVAQEKFVPNGFKFKVNDSIQNNLPVMFTVKAVDQQDSVTYSTFQITAHAPDVTILSMTIDDIAPGGLKIVISCFVYAVNEHPVLRPDRREVADAFWVAASELKNPARISSLEFIFRNRLRRFPALRVADDKEQTLWGITYNLLRNFYKVVHNAPKQNRRDIREAHNGTRTKSKCDLPPRSLTSL